MAISCAHRGISMIRQETNKVDFIGLLESSPTMATSALLIMHADLINDYLDLNAVPNCRENINLVRERLLLAAGHVAAVIGALGRAISTQPADADASKRQAATLLAAVNAAARAQASARQAWAATFPSAAGRA